MLIRKWIKEEFEKVLRLHAAGWSAEKISEVVSRTPAAIRLKLISAGFSSETLRIASYSESPEPPVSPAASQVDEPTRDEEISFARNQAEQLLEARDLQIQNRYDRQRAMEQAQRDRFLRIFEETLRDCRLNFTVTPPPIPTEVKKSHSAVLLVGDVHIGKACKPAETEGRAVYNPAISVARLAWLEREVIHLVSSGPPVDELVVLFCGDIVEGILDHGAEREETILLSKQFALAVTILAQFLIRLASLAPKLRVYGVAGNHGRWPNQRKMPTVGRESNFDGLIYAALQMVLTAACAKSVAFDLRDSSRQLVAVKNILIQLAHGDELRGGEYYTAGIKREVFNSVLRYAQEGRIPDLWITGDKHVSISLPVGNGQFLINGSFVGEDNFSQRFSPAIPSQTLFWVCPSRGKTLQADIRLDRAVPSSVLPYQLPTPLEELVKSYNATQN